MFQKGHPRLPGAGRKKGTLNSKPSWKTAKEAFASRGIDAVDILADAYYDAKADGDTERSDKLAMHISKLLISPPKQVDHTGSVDVHNMIDVTHTERAQLNAILEDPEAMRAVKLLEKKHKEIQVVSNEAVEPRGKESHALGGTCAPTDTDNKFLKS